MRLFFATIIIITLLFSCSANYANAQSSTLKQLNTYPYCNTNKNAFCRIDFNSGGDLIATASLNSTVTLWRTDNGQVMQQLPHQNGALSLDFSDDGHFLATGDYHGNIRIWQVNTGELVHSFAGDNSMIEALVFSPDGATLASSNELGNVTMRQWQNGTKLELKGHAGGVWSLAFNLDCTLLLSAGEDENINIWQVSTGTLIHQLVDHDGAVLALAFSHDGSILASGGDDYTIKLWDASNWQVMRTIKGDFYSVYSLDFSPDDVTLAAGSRDKSVMAEFFQYHWDYQSNKNATTVSIWDVKTARLLHALSGHSDDVNAVKFSPDGKKLASSSVDGNVILWDNPIVVQN